MSLVIEIQNSLLQVKYCTKGLQNC